MFGPDTSLVMEAIQIAALVALVSVGIVFFRMRRIHGVKPKSSHANERNSTLESRVRVLQRIATDRSADLADAIESLRTPPATNPPAHLQETAR